MLNISNKFEDYQCGDAIATSAVGTSVTHSIEPKLSADCAVNFSNMSPISASKSERESIHSGQFMVSHFEAEEAQDDLDDGEVKMLDPEDPSLSKPDESNRCMEVQLYVPRKVAQFQQCGDFTSGALVTSHIEIETSLTKLFKCMTLAYSQKLTSPKWNHFKGVRLRWKDKIRLNNVIWRCWHMQFILKRRTPVCQFASPLDVDIHNNPQSVVLEGKYWKRQLTVIKAEYRKWRRNYKSKVAGLLTYDTKSEFDFLEWSPLNDRNLMISEDWTSDTLFSAINGPFPFPDPREIARGAGIADFIQPSLGPLQPNLEDIDLTFAELLQNSRLPPVPEEGSDEMLKGVDYGFSSLLGAEQMDSSHIINVAASSVNQIQNNDDTNMVELNTPLSSMQFSDIEQQFAANTNSVGIPSGRITRNTINSDNTMMTDERDSTLLTDATTSNRTQTKHYNSSSDSSLGKQNNEFPGKSVIKGRISKSQRPFRREPHNYDKAQPTLHQTSLYQQMLAEQQKPQLSHHQQPNTNINSGVLHRQTSSFSQEQQSHQYSTHQFSQSSPSSVFRLNSNVYALNSDTTDTNIKSFDLIPTTSDAAAIPGTVNAISSTKQMMLDVKTEPPSSDILSMFHLSTSNNGYNSNMSYKPYPNIMSFKKSASTGTYINMHEPGINQNYAQEQSERQTSTHVPLNALNSQLSSLANTIQVQQQQQQQQQIQSQAHIQQIMQPHQVMPKEMFRSNSLPLNVSLQKLDTHLSHDNNFAVPKYQAKTAKPRSRSNSINQHTSTSNSSSNNLRVSQQLQAATYASDPMLNSTLAQLLTTSTRMTPLGKQQSSSTSAISSINNPMTVEPLTVRTSLNKTQMLHMPNSNIFTQKTNSPISSTLALTTSAIMGPIVLTSPHTKSQEIVQQQTHVKQPQKSPKKSTSLPAQTASLALHSPPASKMLSYPPMTSTQNTSVNYLSHSPESFHDQDSPLSPTHSSKFPRDSQRRAGHIHAEQKRRYNIKNGFDMLHSLIPQLQQNPNAKLSKAAMLQKAADHIKHLRSERNILKDKMDALRRERDALNNSLSHLHSILPANGAPVTRQGTEHVRQLYEQYVRYHTTNNNWKFWILGLILEPLLSSYTSSVSSASMDELRRTAFLWVDQHCSLLDLRPAVSNKLKYLSMKTDILSDPPSTLQKEIEKAVSNSASQHPNLHGT